jgi:uncharacterized protein
MSAQPMLVYIHGLNSCSQSAKARLLQERLAPFPVAAIDYPAHRPDAAIATLSAFFAALAEPLPAVIGSSMGGFYSQYLARRFSFSHLFMINPALVPWELLSEHLGESMTTAQGEPYEITDAFAVATQAYGVPNPCDGIQTTLFLDRGDAVIDYRIAERLYASCGRVLIWDDGDHAFQHMEPAIEVIRAHLLERGSFTR